MLRKRPKNGFLLIEVLVALAIVVISSSVLMRWFMQSVQLSNDMNVRIQALEKMLTVIESRTAVSDVEIRERVVISDNNIKQQLLLVCGTTVVVPEQFSVCELQTSVRSASGAMHTIKIVSVK